MSTLPIWPTAGHTYTAEEVVAWLDRQRMELQETKRQLRESIDEIESLRGEVQRHEEKARAEAGAKPPAELLAGEITPQSILQAMNGILVSLTNGSMTAADAKARLYAHQIALSAMRTLDAAKARRQKEERLRSQNNRKLKTTRSRRKNPGRIGRE